MGVTKTNLYTQEQNSLALAAKAFSHPARVAIIQHLLQTKSCVNGELVLEIGLAQATISQHVRELKEIGIIQGTIEGVSVNYCINPKRWSEIANMFSQIFESYTGLPIDECC